MNPEQFSDLITHLGKIEALMQVGIGAVLSLIVAIVWKV